ncbi:MBL fold metallo-hydrolase [Siccirubricoccus sp. KC 17139]|uniref:MBL fold metallo-hydrolase n=1 Tax=Siccirubricoccus soli TaxID=2899147 RepID=A0ABT1D4V6_9PROT|nr:MBL fold metallo-hydrolase [Siccirubricoccus soli]MCO6416949.1 MBL fold metallo-hydrolase [Siccirubricoccus soli]MCP2683084.1 MBL fold metallo-hydrolase [Siccirubricoccus soli]
MPLFLCQTCSTQFAESAAPQPACPICEDERQYVPARGQQWTTLERLRGGHANTWRALEPELLAIRSVPAVGIDQRALLVRTQQGNLLWDCIALLDEATITLVRALGGLTGVAISHPHYYSAMVEWGREFGVPVWLHAADRQHVMRPDPCLRFWEGDRQPVLPGLTLHRLGGHFAGGTIAHWEAGAGGRGALLSGDILQVMPDRKHLGFMRSYPCLIPLPPAEVQRMAAYCEGLGFDAIYGAFQEREIVAGAKAALAKSAARYCAWVSGMVEP